MFHRPHDRVQLETGSDTRTQQHMKDQCDINNILKGYRRHGVIEHVKAFEGRYGDFIGAPEYHEAMNQLVLAQNMFDTLPAQIRKRFSNDPAEFLDFAQDPSNEAHMRELGLIPPEVPNEPRTAPAAAAGASGASSNATAEEAPASASAESA